MGKEFKKVRPKILLVEDELITQRVCCLILKKIGCEVIVTSHGEEALKILDERIDGVLVDINLPDITGFTLIERIRLSNKIIKKLPIYILSSHNSIFINQNLKGIKINGVISKPVSLEAMKDAVEKLINN